MPSRLPRIKITLPEHTESTLRLFAAEVGKPPATVIAQLLTEMVPQLEGVIKIARATRAGNKAAADRALRHMVGDGMAEVLNDQQRELELARKGRK